MKEKVRKKDIAYVVILFILLILIGFSRITNFFTESVDWAAFGIAFALVVSFCLVYFYIMYLIRKRRKMKNKIKSKKRKK